jgi:CHAT domain-containing protein/Tfp pilus assembly protein PilF
LAIKEKALGPDHPEVAESLNNLGGFYRVQGHYADAEQLIKRSLSIFERALGPNHPSLAHPLNNLAGLYEIQGRYSDAEAPYKQSLAIREKALGPEHPDVANLLNNLAELYRLQGRYAEAEPLYERSLAIREKVFGFDHLDVALSLNNLAALRTDQGRYAEAEPLYRRSLAIKEKVLKPDHPDIALAVNNLAGVYMARGRYAEAEQFYKQSLAIREKALGPDHPDVSASLNNLAELYRAQGRYGEAEPLYKRSLAIWEKTLGPNHPAVATALSNLAILYDNEGRYAETEQLYRRSLIIRETALGPDHRDVALSLNNLAELYRTQARYPEAEPLYKRSLTIWEKALGPDHPLVALSLTNLALFTHQGRYAEAELLLKRALVIDENAFGPFHPDVAGQLNSLAVLYTTQHRYIEAEPLYKRALAINENTFGPDHPQVTSSLNGLAFVYDMQARYAEALPIVKRTIAQTRATKSGALNVTRNIVLSVMHHAESQKLITSSESFVSGYEVFQRSFSSAAGEAVSRLAARFAAGSNELAQLVREDQDLAAEANRLEKNIIDAVSKLPPARNATAETQMRRRIDEIKSQRENLQEVFNRRFPDYVATSKPQPLSVQETQALLDDDEALVAFDLDQMSYVWVITRTRAEWKQLAVSAADVSKSVARLRDALDPESPKSFDFQLAYQLYQQILGPITEIIEGKNRLSFVLSGALTSLPPQVLITSDPENRDLASVDWLMRKYAVTVLPSVASLKILRGGKSVVAAAEPMVGFGDPVFDRTSQRGTIQKVATLNRSPVAFHRGLTADTVALAHALPPLPETADELRAIGKELGAKSEDIHVGEAASVPNVKHAKLDNYRVVYFATHALIAGEVEKFAKVKAEPALVLSIPQKPTDEDDGLLRASDVAMLKMNAEFVVLSACNTAAGDKPGAEALSGLARAFFYAGARSLIVSNWEVDSESTVALMTGLFNALKNNSHLSHAEALRLSMLQMIGNASKLDWAQPKFWAPFIVVGEPQKN